MSEADFCGMDAGEYYATKDFLDRERFYRKQVIIMNGQQLIMTHRRRLRTTKF